MQVRCSACGKPFEGQRSTAKFCSGKCRQRSSRQALLGAPEKAPEPSLSLVPAPKTGEHPLITATRRELADADRLDTVAGQQALRLAEKMASNFDTGSALAAVSKELSRAMSEALANVATQADSLDELASRRLKRASGA